MFMFFYAEAVPKQEPCHEEWHITVFVGPAISFLQIGLEQKTIGSCGKKGPKKSLVQYRPPE